jgi:hypothetical protein
MARRTRRRVNRRVLLQVCGRVQEAGLLSAEGMSQQRESQRLLLKQLAEIISVCGKEAGEVGTPLAIEALEKATVPLPSRRLQFNGKSLCQVEGWAHTESAAIHAGLER